MDNNRAIFVSLRNNYPQALKVIGAMRKNFRPNLVLNGFSGEVAVIQDSSSPFARTFGVPAPPKWKYIGVVDMATLRGYGIDERSYDAYQDWIRAIDVNSILSVRSVRSKFLRDCLIGKFKI